MGGNLSFWFSEFYGPCAKLDRDRSVLFARWLMDAQKSQGLAFQNRNKLDLDCDNLKLNKLGSRYAERPLMRDALDARGYPLPLDLSRLVQPCDLVGPFEPLA
jgi:hypothetical protein